MLVLAPMEGLRLVEGPMAERQRGWWKVKLEWGKEWTERGVEKSLLLKVMSSLLLLKLKAKLSKFLSLGRREGAEWWNRRRWLKCLRWSGRS